MSVTIQALAVTFRDGKTYAGQSPADVVARIRESGLLTRAQTNRDYMRAAAARYRELEGAAIRCDSAEHFLADLEAAAIVTRNILS